MSSAFGTKKGIGGAVAGSPSGQNKASAGGSTSSSTSKESINLSNMDPSSMAALKLLIEQLLGGGTPAMALQNQQRQNAIQQVNNQIGEFSKVNAFSDAQGAMNQALQQAMEKALPSLVRSAEGAGTSANSMRALLTQDALTRASQAAAALGLDAATKYGTVGANLSNVLQTLTSGPDPVTAALLQALQIAKGDVQTGSRTTESSGKSTGMSNPLNAAGQPIPYVNGGVGNQGGAAYFGFDTSFPSQSNANNPASVFYNPPSTPLTGIAPSGFSINDLNNLYNQLGSGYFSNYVGA